MGNLVHNAKLQPFYFFSIVFIGGCLLLLAYLPSFTVPFYLDDRQSIYDNTLLLQPSISALFHHYGLRFITYLSFWINAQWFDGSILSYHILNFTIHIINGVLIYTLVKCLTKKYSSHNNKTVMLFSAAVTFIWLYHPLNTQAVTYIVQRTASLVTLFALLTGLSYLKLRLNKVSWLWLTLAALSILCGMLTKQNFVVVFVFIFLFEYFIIETHKKRMIAAIVIALFVTALLSPFFPNVMLSLSRLTVETTAISRFDYFVTQTAVLWLYIAKFLYPTALQLDMGVELATPSTGLHFLAFVSHILLIFIAVKVRKVIPLFSIGILWFYAGHSIESFIIPITDLAFEHRTYLPNVGLVLSFTALLYQFVENKPTLLKIMIVLICIILSVLTYKRNTQWQTAYSFYQNELKLSPHSPRSKASLAHELMLKGNLIEAQKLLIESVNSNMQKGKVTVTSLNNLMLVLFEQGNYQTGIQTAMLALKYVKKPLDKSNILTTIAYGYIKMGYCDFAKGLSKTAIKLGPQNKRAKEYFTFCNEKRLK